MTDAHGTTSGGDRRLADTPQMAIDAIRTPGRVGLLGTEGRLAVALVLPVVIVILAVAVYPLVYAVSLSFRQVRFGVPGDWVGLDNYRRLVDDPRLFDAFRNTVVFTLSTVSLEFVLGLAIALLINRAFVGRALVRAAILIPWAFPAVVSAIMWRLMFQDQIGIMDYLIRQTGLVHRPILTDETLTMIAAIFVSVWKTTPFMALLLLAGLQTIPGELYESARVDGADAWERFRSITLPLLRPAIVVAVLFRTLDAWRVYELFAVFSDNRLESFATYIYEAVRVSELRFALGNAAAVVMFFSSMLIALVFVRFFGLRPAGGDR